jgi:hypothetical protein
MINEPVNPEQALNALSLIATRLTAVVKSRLIIVSYPLALNKLSNALAPIVVIEYVPLAVSVYVAGICNVS